MRYYLLILVPIFLLSCAVKPIQSEIDYSPLSKPETTVNQLGNGRVLFYNGQYYCPVYTCGTATKVNMYLDSVSLGQINYGEYFIVDLESKQYSLQMECKYFWKVSSEKTINITDDTKIVKIHPTDTNVKVDVTNELPRDFESFQQLHN